jgi:hypothetical protein
MIEYYNQKRLEDRLDSEWYGTDVVKGWEPEKKVCLNSTLYSSFQRQKIY